ncbi:unnamed protein product, partial [Symbiodinium pilosum]
QSMVMLPLPWADTRYEVTTEEVQFPGARRLQGADDESLKCSGWVRELLPCEEEIATSDRISPSIAQAIVADVESTTEGFLTGTTERITWQMELRDGSCSHRVGSATTCIVRCHIVEEDLAWLIQSPSHSDGCMYPRCSQKSWSNEYPVYLTFGQLRPAKEYTARCLVMDPWGNAITSDFKIWVPGQSTQSTSSTPTPTTQLPTLPPTTRAPTTAAPPTTQPVDYWTRPPATTQGGGGQTAPPTTRPPLIYTTSATPAPPTTPRTTSTTTEAPTTQPPTVPPWLSDYTPSGPVRTELSLSTSSREDAEALIFPTAANALVSALRLALG